jgi:hypothetical protein
MSLTRAGLSTPTTALWVIDNKDTKLTPDGTAPAGEMYQIDPGSGDVLDRLPGAVGGWQSVGAGAICCPRLPEISTCSPGST